MYPFRLFKHLDGKGKTKTQSFTQMSDLCDAKQMNI